MSRVEPSLREAQRADLPDIMALLADDEFSRGREAGPEAALDPAVAAAFEELEADPNSFVFVLVVADRIVGTAQLTVVPGLSRGALKRGLVEAVRVASAERGRGLGGWLMTRLATIAREHGCGMMQLTSDKRRTDAHRFYRERGYTQSHEGFKLMLD